MLKNANTKSKLLLIINKTLLNFLEIRIGEVYQIAIIIKIFFSFTKLKLMIN